MHTACAGDLTACAPFRNDGAGELEHSNLRCDRPFIEEIDGLHGGRARPGSFDQRAAIQEGRPDPATAMIMSQAIHRQLPATQVDDFGIVVSIEPFATKPCDGARVGEHRRSRAVAGGQPHIITAAQQCAPSRRDGVSSVQMAAGPVKKPSNLQQSRAGQRKPVSVGHAQLAPREHKAVRAERQADAVVDMKPLRHAAAIRPQRETGDRGGDVEGHREIGRASDGDVVARQGNAGGRPVVGVTPQSVSTCAGP